MGLYYFNLLGSWTKSEFQTLWTLSIAPISSSIGKLSFKRFSVWSDRGSVGYSFPIQYPFDFTFEKLNMPFLLFLQYKKSKVPPKCTGLFLLDEWIESLFDHGNVISTSITLVISNNFCLKNTCLVIFYQGFEGQNMKLSTEDDFVFVGNCISRLVSH